MNILQDLQESLGLERLVGKSDDDVKNAFLANYLAGLLLLKLHDLKGLLLLNDPTHARLTRFTPSMSDLNFWGKALFFPDDPQVERRLQPGHARVLKQDAHKIVVNRVHEIMKLPLTPPESVNWNEVIAVLVLLRERFGVTSSHFRDILYYLSRWDSISETQKKRAVNAAFMYLLQSDPRSSLLSRLRALSTSSMLHGLTNAAYKLLGFKRLAEDDAGGATGTGNVATGGDAGFAPDNAIVAPSDCDQNHQNSWIGNLYRFDRSPKFTKKKNKYNLFNNKVVKKRKRKFKPVTFKAPDFMRTRRET